VTAAVLLSVTVTVTVALLVLVLAPRVVPLVALVLDGGWR
jgi:hypothetical protein